MNNEQKVNEMLLELGHNERHRGTQMIRIGAALYERDALLTKELYPAIAAATNSTASRVERSIRHSICEAWTRGSHDAQLKYFGHSINPDTGTPTVGQYLATVARIYHEN